MKPFSKISNSRQIRNRLGMNQQEFWTRIGVTQSGGSRYENGRSMLKPVRELLRLVHIEGVELMHAGPDCMVGSRLAKTEPQKYEAYYKASKKREKDAKKIKGGR